MISKFDREERCTNAIEKCVVNNALCGNGNPCMTGRLCSSCHTDDRFPEAPVCGPLVQQPNGQACSSACYVSGSSTCSSGQCTGTCRGYCNESNSAASCNSTMFPFSQDVLNYINRTHTDYPGGMQIYTECLGDVCYAYIGDIQYITDFPVYSQEDPTYRGNFIGEADPEYWRRVCRSLLSNTSTTAPCLNVNFFYGPDSFSNIYGLNCTTGTGIVQNQPDGSDSEVWCLYSYSCTSPSYPISDFRRKRSPKPLHRKTSETAYHQVGS